ncbi:hypothetical protein BH10PLA1_BH10PLA1_20430 [soil metagenome]
MPSRRRRQGKASVCMHDKSEYEIDVVRCEGGNLTDVVVIRQK